ncbi:MAG: ATP-binding protein [Polyangiaceae bacterium]
MHADTVAGYLSALAVNYVAIAGYCLLAVASRRGKRASRALFQREELPYLLFAALTASLAAYSAGCGLYYVSDRWREAMLVANAGRIAAVAFLAHLVLVTTDLPRPRALLLGLYGTFAGLEAANFVGGFYEIEHARPRVVEVFGVSLREMAVPVTALSILFAGASLVAVGGATALLARSFVHGRREGLWSFLGAVMLTVTVAHDAARSLGWLGGIELSPYGYEALVLGMLASLIEQYMRLRRRLEARASELRSRSRELATSFEELRAAQTELVRKEQLAAVGELSAVVAHEVRNPLAIISNAVATLRRPDVADSDRATLLGILDEETVRLNHIVGDLLSYARPVRLERREVMIAEIVERALVLAERDPDIIVERADARDVDAVLGDPGLLRQVMENLITNAVQAMPSGGHLTVGIRACDHEGTAGVEVRVQDTGEGMNTAVRRRALDPFFTTRPRGTGLGLAIVARIIDAHGGELVIDSTAGAGTVVRVLLPCASEPASRSGDAAGDRRSSLPPMPVELQRALLGRRP